jgi:hypothetical protein
MYPTLLHKQNSFFANLLCIVPILVRICTAEAIHNFEQNLLFQLHCKASKPVFTNVLSKIWPKWIRKIGSRLPGQRRGDVAAARAAEAAGPEPDVPGPSGCQLVHRLPPDHSLHLAKASTPKSCCEKVAQGPEEQTRDLLFFSVYFSPFFR